MASWELYQVFCEAGIKPAGRLTKTEYRRFQRVLAVRSELEPLHFSIALRMSNLEPIEMAEQARREALECLTMSG